MKDMQEQQQQQQNEDDSEDELDHDLSEKKVKDASKNVSIREAVHCLHFAKFLANP